MAIALSVLQAREFLHEHQLAWMTILVFSDMNEDLPERYNRDLAITFDNTKVLAVNVTKLRSDNVDPQEYLDRMSQLLKWPEGWRYEQLYISITDSQKAKNKGDLLLLSKYLQSSFQENSLLTWAF